MNKKNKIKSIKRYINDKEEMINQVFSCITEKQLKKMTPDPLKDMSIDELKAECLVQLLTMSNNTIISVLEGQKSFAKKAEKIDDNCKDVDLTMENSEDKRTHNTILKVAKDKEGVKLPTIVQSDTEDSLGDENEASSTTYKRKLKDKKHKSEKRKRKISLDEEKGLDDSESKGRNLLEILELEMRAKAIRSLLKKEEELEKLKEFNVEPKNKTCGGSEKQKNQVNLKEAEEIRKTNTQIIISKNEIKKKINREGVKEEEINLQTKPLLYQSSLNIMNKLKQKIDDKEISSSQTGLDGGNKRENYDWNAEEEKLIYEDDEYDSDDKLEAETNKEEVRSEENSRSSWAERWLQSKDVQKVVATSKMLTVVRNKMKNNLKSSNKQTVMTNQMQPKEEPEGSVKQYDSLRQMHEAVMAAAINSSTSNTYAT